MLLVPSTRCRGQEAERKRSAAAAAAAEADRKRAEAAAQVCSAGCGCGLECVLARALPARHDTTRQWCFFPVSYLCVSSLVVCRLVLSGWVVGVPGRAATSSSSSSGGSCQGGAWLWIVLQANADADDAGVGAPVFRKAVTGSCCC